MQKLRFSLVTYNIHKGFGLSKRRFVLPEMRFALAALNPDFIFLQEVQGQHQLRAKKVYNWPQVPQFEYMAEPDWPHYLYAKNAIYKLGHHGNAILSKYPFQSFGNENLSHRHHASRSILHGEIHLGDICLHLLCVHLGLFKAERISQCQAIISKIQALIPEQAPVLMAGDFNDWRMHLSKSFKEELGLEEAFQSLEGKHARSFPAIRPTFRIDRIYFRGLEVKEVDCLRGKPWRDLSDHLPLFAEFELLV